MTIHFLYGRRESLTGKAEAYKRSIRAYLEAFGFSQTTDSIVEGTFEDMVFYNPIIAPKQKFLIEAKAEDLSLKSKKFADELVKYYKLWRAIEPNERFKFMLFAQSVKKPKDWELMFSEIGNISTVKKWCDWYNNKCIKMNEPSAKIKGKDILDIAKFFAESEVSIGNRVQLELAISEKELQSASSIPRIATNLLGIVNKRKVPIMEKSTLIMNILPINVPEFYYTCGSTALNKTEIYDSLRGEWIPPFVWRKDRSLMSFVKFDTDNPLFEFIEGSPKTKKTKKLQTENPTLSSLLVNIHLRRIIWS